MRDFVVPAILWTEGSVCIRWFSEKSIVITWMYQPRPCNALPNFRGEMSQFQVCKKYNKNPIFASKSVSVYRTGREKTCQKCLLLTRHRVILPNIPDFHKKKWVWHEFVTWNDIKLKCWRFEGQNSAFSGYYFKMLVSKLNFSYSIQFYPGRAHTYFFLHLNFALWKTL